MILLILRKKLYNEYKKRGYPENSKNINEIRNIRLKKAALLKYNSWTEIDIDPKTRMAKGIHDVQNFLQHINLITQQRALEEISLLSHFAKNHCYINDPVEPWDELYIKAQYKKKVYELDDSIMTEYFPTWLTIDKLLLLYSNITGVDLVREKIDDSHIWKWSEDIFFINVYKDNLLIGRVICDIFPRSSKYTHACCCELACSSNNKNDHNNIPMAIIVTNFTPETSLRKSCLRAEELDTFVHELGHAMHCIIGRGSFYAFSGYNTALDFIEVPSQLFEQWLKDPLVLTYISEHFQTGEKIPKELLTKHIQSLNFGQAIDFQFLLARSDLALQMFLPTNETAEMIAQRIYPSYLSLSGKHEPTKEICNFLHLDEYGASYYVYLWSLAYALIIFEKIKQTKSLLYPDSSKQLIECILRPGGSMDYNVMMKNFMACDDYNLFSTLEKMFL
mgnify:CR=1 FL=1